MVTSPSAFYTKILPDFVQGRKNQYQGSFSLHLLIPQLYPAPLMPGPSDNNTMEHSMILKELFRLNNGTRINQFNEYNNNHNTENEDNER